MNNVFRTLAAGALMLLATVARAQTRQDVTFLVSQTTVVGQSIFVLGDLPELGGNDLRKSVKLEPSTYPNWKATISLPRGRSFTYRYYLRNDAPGQGSNLANGTAISGVLAGSTVSDLTALPGKVVLYHSNWAAPVLNWRQGTGAFQSMRMMATSTARSAAETRFLAQVRMARSGQPIEFFITNAPTGGRDPATGTYTTPADAALLQDGLLYTYIPAASVGAPRRAYTVASPPSLFSTNLNENRPYRVFLPRGYDQHTGKRYPVLYFHDGQNIMDQGPFGSWNAATTLTSLQNSATMREIIVVGVDNTSNRLNDYSPPDNGGRGDKYTRFIRDELKPVIDAAYRTIPDASVTGSAGSSMGGMIALYEGWDFTGTFTRIGAFSGAWNVGWSTAQNTNITSTAFYDRVRNDATSRAIRLYLDSGDSGTASDNYWLTYNLRDNLLARPAATRYALEGAMEHVLGLGQQHNEAAWSARLPGALTYLYSISDEANELEGYFWLNPRTGDDEQPGLDDAQFEATASGGAIGLP